MAIVLIEGFDHFSAGDANEKGWNGLIFATEPGRIPWDGQSIVVIGNNPLQKILPGSYASLVIGVALKPIQDSSWGHSATFLILRSGATRVLTFGVSADYMVLTDAAGRQYLGPVLPLDSWSYIEIKVTVGTSAAASVRLNGSEVISTSTGNFGTADIDRIEFDADVLCSAGIDDLYVLDTTGAAPQNDFLGDVVVKTLHPILDGAHTDWTPLTGTDHYAMVDETLADGDASYVHDANAGDKDSYVMQTIAAPTIYSAQLNVIARKGDAGTRQIAPLVRQAATDHVGSTFTISSDYLAYSWILDRDPTGSTWTAATIASDEFGMELVA